MTTKAITGLIVAVLLGCIGVPMLLVSAVLGGSGGCTPAYPNGSGQPGIGRWDREQVSIAATIVHVGVTKGVPRWGWVVALATAMQESQLRNLPHLGENNDHDSIGVFQQRPSQGWGTPQQLADPTYQAGKFYEKLLTIPGWQQMPLTEAAQRVQVSAYPEAYAKWTSDAIQLADAVASQGSWAILGDLEQCVSTAGWTHPLPGYQVTSGFRTAGRPSHDGADLPAPRQTPIRAAAAGEVIKVRCNAIDRRDGSDWGCDRDGDPDLTGGCGWFLELLHPGNVMTRYCHLDTAPLVRVGDQVLAGQPIGVVGSTGHSSGPHLHIEVHLNADRDSTGQAVDPVSFLRSMGIPGL
ncbi:M23 family metallopeptidase [Allorhizocola rhizosphaerae]|uniref:M23 family metallopeptidase n=1 Tax=Allorhizocola rhizosphaerae TaxID=1872709 RepID=UPI000E3D9B74|nr:M23 family metallopeptidase [Allorhizocola rhizosphaerae]